jgi:hypothetical protein
MIRYVLIALIAPLLFACGRAPQSAGPDTAAASQAAAALASTATAAGAGSSFDRTLDLQGIRFVVTSPNTSVDNRVSIAPSGLEIDNGPVEWPVDGRVIDARVADLDADGSPEVYVFATSDGSGSYGSLVGYATNRRKSMSQVYLAPIAGDTKLAPGYRGHDAFDIDAKALVRRYPLYRDGDANASPSGGAREVRYRLAPGEAGWLFVVDSVVDRP